MFSSKPLTPAKISEKIGSALYNGNIDKLKTLLMMPGADTNYRKEYQSSHLYCAVASDYLRREEMVDLLLVAGARPDASSMIRACERHMVNVVKKFIEAGIDVNIQDSYKNTALHVAAQYGHGDIVKLLLDAGADPNIGNSHLNKPADVAEEKHPRVAEFIRNHPSYQKTEPLLLPEAPNEWQVTGAVEITRVSDKKQVGLTLTEIFNFETRVYLCVTHNKAANIQSQTLERFDMLEGTSLLEMAAEELSKRGVANDVVNGYLAGKRRFKA